MLSGEGDQSPSQYQSSLEHLDDQAHWQHQDDEEHLKFWGHLERWER
jgi:hypothetical protein